MKINIRDELKKARVRISILRGRMEACNEDARALHRDEPHGVSMIEVGGWLQEMDELIASLGPKSEHVPALEQIAKSNPRYATPHSLVKIAREALSAITE